MVFLTRLTLWLLRVLVLILHVLQRLTGMVVLRIVRGAEQVITRLVIIWIALVHLTGVGAGH